MIPICISWSIFRGRKNALKWCCCRFNQSVGNFGSANLVQLLAAEDPKIYKQDKAVKICLFYLLCSTVAPPMEKECNSSKKSSKYVTSRNPFFCTHPVNELIKYLYINWLDEIR